GWPARSAGSRFTSSPAARSASAVRLSVSGTASNAIEPFSTATVVRQQPSIEIESPTEAPAEVAGAATTRRTPPSPPLRAAIRPRSRTSPVNMRPRLPRRRRQGPVVERAAAGDLRREHPVGQPLDGRAVVGQRRRGLLHGL